MSTAAMNDILTRQPSIGDRAGAAHGAPERSHVVQLYESDDGLRDTVLPCDGGPPRDDAEEEAPLSRTHLAAEIVQRRQVETALRASVQDLRRAEEESRHARQRAELLYALARAVIEAVSVGDVFVAALHTIERALGAERASVLALDPDGVMRFKAWRGLSEEYRRAVEGHSPWPRGAHDPQPVLVQDVEGDGAMAPYLPVLRKEGIRALGFIPLVASGRLLGKFMVYYDRPRALGPSERDLATAIANHVAAAMARFSAVDELQQTVRFNEMFTAILGHDLRDPLGAIMAGAELAMERDGARLLAQPLGRILDSSEQMARMIDQMLDFTRVRVGQGMVLEPAEADLVPLLQQVRDQVAGAAAASPILIEHVGDAVGVWDEDRLGRVFSNLVGNAVRHGVPGHDVRVRVDGTAPGVVRVVIDNLGAVPPDVLPRLFEPMSGGARRREGSQGLGLGLFITRQIVEAHGGSVDVQSTEATGTTFTVSLPRAPPAAHGAPRT